MDGEPAIPGAFNAIPHLEPNDQETGSGLSSLRQDCAIDHRPFVALADDMQISLPGVSSKINVKSIVSSNRWPALLSRPIHSTLSAAKSLLKWVQEGARDKCSVNVIVADDSRNVVTVPRVRIDKSKSKKRKFSSTYTSRIPLAVGRKVPRIDQTTPLSQEESMIRTVLETSSRTPPMIQHWREPSSHHDTCSGVGKLFSTGQGHHYTPNRTQRARSALKGHDGKGGLTRVPTRERETAFTLQSRLRTSTHVRDSAIGRSVRSGNGSSTDEEDKVVKNFRGDFPHWMSTRSSRVNRNPWLDLAGHNSHENPIQLPSHAPSVVKPFPRDLATDVLSTHFSSGGKAEAQSKSSPQKQEEECLPRMITDELLTQPTTTSVLSPSSFYQNTDVLAEGSGDDPLIARGLDRCDLSLYSRSSDPVCSSPTRETSVPPLQHEHTTSLSSHDSSPSHESSGVLLTKQELSDPVTIAGDLLLELEISGAGEKQHKAWRQETKARLVREAAEKARIHALEQELLVKQRLEASRARLGRRIPEHPFIHRLTQEWDDRVDVASKKSPTAIVAKTSSGTELRRRDLMTVLARTTWLNDEIINAYIDTIVDHVNSRSGRKGTNDIPKIIAHNSFFYKNIAEKGPNSVARWMKRKKAEGKKLLEVETILIPVNSNSHWTLIVVSPKTKTIEYLDSFGGNPHNYIEHVRMWLRATLQDDWVEDEWVSVDTSVCQQHNGYDCGVFLLTNAECVAFGHTTDSYAATDMAAQRRRIGAILLNGGFL